jgi:glycosyltransferase involved in cell wall biosynthesis
MNNVDCKNIPTIGTFGRFADQKGFDILLQSLKFLKDDGIKFKAKIGGGGEDKELLENLVNKFELNELVEFTGWVTDKQKFFDDIDIFCLSSREEAFGIVLLEAMKYKTAIIATDCDGPLDIIKDGENGLLVRKQNPRSLADGLKVILADADLRKKFAENAYQTLLENYTEEIVGEKLENALKEIVARSANSKLK